MKIVHKALIATALCITLNFLPAILESIFALPLEMQSAGNGVTLSRQLSLHEGSYFLSVGKTMATADIRINGQVISRGLLVANQKKPHTSYGVAFEAKGPTQIQISFDSTSKNFQNNFYRPPIVAPYHVGIFLHHVRDLFDIQLGPISSLLLLLCALAIGFLDTKAVSTISQHIHYTAFALISLMYSFSFSHVTRSYFDPTVAMKIHMGLRFLLGFGVYNLLHAHSKPRKSLLVALSLAAACPFIIPATVANPTLVYKTMFFILPLSMLIGFIDLTQDTRSSTNFLFSGYALSWAIAQTFDFVRLWAEAGVFLTPIYLVLFNIVVLSVLKDDLLASDKLNDFSKTVTSIINNGDDIQKTITFLGHEIWKHSPYKAVSAYVDAYLIGKSSAPFQEYHLVYQGDKNAARKEIYLAREEAGSSMQDALRSDQLIIRRSERDEQWYVCVPAFQFICFNITTTTKLPDHALSEVNAMVKILMSLLPLLKDRIHLADAAMGSSLSSLRKILPVGLHKRFTGAVFLDLVDYSKHTELYGTPYTDYVSADLFPALIKHMKGFALPEVVRGDEIYFVVSPETCNLQEPLDIMTTAVLERVHQFFAVAGQKISQEHGFPLPKIRLGACIGDGSIVVDDVQVRTSGDHINRAKRLQDAAVPGEYLTDFIPQSENNSVIVLSKKTVVVKKNVIEAVKVGVKRAA